MAAEDIEDTDAFIPETHGHGVDRDEAGGPGGGDEPGPPADLRAKVLDRERLARPEALQTRAFLVLQLEELQRSGPFIRGGHQVQRATGVGQKNPGFGRIQALESPMDEEIEEIHHVEVIDQRVGQLNERLNQPSLTAA